MPDDFHEKDFMDIYNRMIEREPRGVRYCPKINKDIYLSSLPHLRCWECEYCVYFSNDEEHNYCDPL